MSQLTSVKGIPGLSLERANHAALNGDFPKALTDLRSRLGLGPIFHRKLDAPWFDPIRQTEDFKAIEVENLRLINAQRQKLGWTSLAQVPG